MEAERVVFKLKEAIEHDSLRQLEEECTQTSSQIDEYIKVNLSSSDFGLENMQKQLLGLPHFHYCCE